MYYKLTYIAEHSSGKSFKRCSYFLTAQLALETLVRYNNNSPIYWKYFPVSLEHCAIPHNEYPYPDVFDSE